MERGRTNYLRLLGADQRALFAEAEVQGYLQGAGFADVTVHPFVPGVLSRVTGRKPA